MKTIDTYITEKLHLTTDNKENLVHEPLHARLCKVTAEVVNEIIEQVFGANSRLKTTDYIIAVEDDRGNIVDDNPKNEDKIARINFWSKNERFRTNINNIAPKVSKALNKIKEVKKAEAFATSFIIYFKDYKSA